MFLNTTKQENEIRFTLNTIFLYELYNYYLSYVYKNFFSCSMFFMYV